MFLWFKMSGHLDDPTSYIEFLDITFDDLW